MVFARRLGANFSSSVKAVKLMKRRILFLILTVAKFTGLFFVARRVTARDLRILCYHGIALQDEHRFRPGLFMAPDTFRRRMAYLDQHNYHVISLDEAVTRTKGGTRADCATVITIDDGWYGTYAVMRPVLLERGFPATLYIASYYLEKQVPVFNVATGYVLWRAREQMLDMGRVSGELSGTFDLSEPPQRDQASRILTEFGNSLGSASERRDLLRSICKTIGIDWYELERRRLCAFMNASEARELLAGGVDIQLHTHRHRSRPETFEQAEAEISDNRQALDSISPGPLRHFCYPSGQYNSREAEWLERLDIVSAVTVTGGFNQPGAPVYELHRFLDSESITELEFEAEMSGFFELIRRCGISI